jgi:hypothetical protein
MAWMVKRSSNLLAILLLTTMVTVSVAGQDASVMVAAQPRAAGCHQHGSTTPASQPVSYRCCQSGHDFVILQVSLISQLSFAHAVSAADSRPVPILNSTPHSLRSLTVSSSDPPDTTPLRV